MFSYYGSKSKIIDYYPPPKYRKIIEPFAGSARYSLKYFENDILLVDKYNVIVNTWKWLQKCTINDILKLPIPKLGENINNYNLSIDEKRLLGFIVQQGTTGMRCTVSKFGFDKIETQLKFIANNLYKIKHWKIIEDTYINIKNTESTWFIDPPYEYGGNYYTHNNKNINYNELAKWCESRNGQIIVCENTKAKWLPFKPMKKMSGSLYVTTEAIWSNYPTNYDYIQTTIF